MSGRAILAALAGAAVGVGIACLLRRFRGFGAPAVNETECRVPFVCVEPY